MNSRNPDVFAIVPAAGSGERLGAGRRKAGVELLGEPLVVWALRALGGVPALVGGALVVHGDDLDRARAEWVPAAGLDGKRWDVVPGGETRSESVWRGVEAAPSSAEFLLVHDAARPLVHPDDLAAVIAGARESGAAILASPVTDTIKYVEGERIVETVDRSRLWRAETPQVARRIDLVRACRRTRLEPATDEAALLESIGIEVRVVPSGYPNPKVTRAIDREVAESLLRTRLTSS